MKTRIVKLMTLFFLSFCSLLFCESFPVNEVLINGENYTRINIVFLSEGFTKSQMRLFNQKVDSTMRQIFATQPYREYQYYFNVYSVEVPSKESGSDHPGTAIDEPQGLSTFTRDTYFNSTFDGSGIHRLLIIQNSEAVYSVLQDNLPDWDIVFIIVNHSWHGGAGGAIAIFSLHSLSFDTAIHEMGHTFAHLADEYESIAGGRAGHEAANATAETRRDFIRWNKWIRGSTPLPTPENEDRYGKVIGLFEGAVYNSTDWYRPKYLCKMRQSRKPFCEVCIEQTILSIYNWLPTFESFEPFNQELTLSGNANIDFIIYPMKPSPNTIQTDWYLNEELIASDTDTFHFRTVGRNYGRHTIEALVTDKSNLVKNNFDKFFRGVVVWEIQVDSTRFADNDVSELIRGFEFHQNFPNPIHNTTTIAFRLPISASVGLKIYNVKGQLVQTLMNGQMLPGFHEITWRTNRVSPGVYFIRLHAGPFSKIRKCLVFR